MLIKVTNIDYKGKFSSPFYVFVPLVLVNLGQIPCSIAYCKAATKKGRNFIPMHLGENNWVNRCPCYFRFHETLAIVYKFWSGWLNGDLFYTILQDLKKV